MIDAVKLIYLLSKHTKNSSFIADKMCDQISDAVLDAHLRQDPDCKVRFFSKLDVLLFHRH